MQYVCYALWALAAVLFLSAKTDVRGMQRPLKIAAGCVSIFIAMSVWTVQEHHSQSYSPREIVIGTVGSVTENHNKGGSFSDDFELLSTTGALSPTLSTDILGDRDSRSHLQRGDLLRVEYRTWDDQVMSFEELSGSNPGYKHLYSPQGLWMVYVGAAVAAGGLLWLFFAWRSYKEGEELVYENNTPDPVPDIQTLNLDDKA